MLAFFAHAQNGGIGIGTTSVDENALLQIGLQNSDAKGVLLPSNTSSNIAGNLTSPTNGLLMYSASENRFVYSKAGSWRYLNPWDTDDVAGGLSAISTSSPVTISNSLSASSASFTGAVTASTFVGNGVVPVGGIIMWNGSATAIPANFQVCDGSNGTPNLTGKFIVAGTPGSGGGTNTLTTSEIVYTAREKYSYEIAGCSQYEKLWTGISHLESCNKGTGSVEFTDVPASSCGDAAEKSGGCTTGSICDPATANPDYYLNNPDCRTDAAVANVVTSTNNRPEFYVLAFIMRIN